MELEQLKKTLYESLNPPLNELIWKYGKVSLNIEAQQIGRNVNFHITVGLKTYKPSNYRGFDIKNGRIIFDGFNINNDENAVKFFAGKLLKNILEYLQANITEYDYFQNIHYFIVDEENQNSPQYKQAVEALSQFVVRFKNYTSPEDKDWQFFRIKEIMKLIANKEMHSDYLYEIIFKYNFIGEKTPTIDFNNFFVKEKDVVVATEIEKEDYVLAYLESLNQKEREVKTEKPTYTQEQLQLLKSAIEARKKRKNKQNNE